MIAELAGWLPKRSFTRCGDGAYATLAGSGLPRTHLVSRIRRDAALFEPAPPPTGRRGRPAKKGARLPTPAALATAAPDKDWTRASIDRRGRKTEVDLLTRAVLWYAVKPDQHVLQVIVRDVARTERDDFFFTTDLDADPADVVTEYHSRWAIEDTFEGGQATPRRPTTTKLERDRPRTRRRALVLDLHRDLVLVHPHPRPRHAGRPGPGTPTSAPPASPTPSPNYERPCGANELTPSPANSNSPHKSWTPSSTRSQEPPDPPEDCESPLLASPAKSRPFA